MKKITLLLTLLSGLGMYAQEDTDTVQKSSIFNRKHEVKVGAVKLLAGPILEGTYEYIQTEDFTFGASVLVNLTDNSDYPEDFSITPFARFYFQETKEYGARGFFVEGFAKYVMGKTYERYMDYDIMEYQDRDEDYSAGAIGLALGKKWVNKSGFVFEVLAGAGRTIGGNDNTPEAVFRGDLNIGYRF